MKAVVLVVDRQSEFFAEVTKMMPSVKNFQQTGWNVAYRIYQFDIDDEKALAAWMRLADNTRGYIKFDVYDSDGRRSAKPEEGVLHENLE